MTRAAANPDVGDGAFADATYRKVSWRLMPFVLLCYVVAYLDRVNVSWIVTFAAASNANPQISVATEGGSGTSVPDLSVEVDNFDEVLLRCAVLAFPSIWASARTLERRAILRQGSVWPATQYPCT